VYTVPGLKHELHFSTIAVAGVELLASQPLAQALSALAKQRAVGERLMGVLDRASTRGATAHGLILLSHRV
jgi:hypothetical protein